MKRNQQRRGAPGPAALAGPSPYPLRSFLWECGTATYLSAPSSRHTGVCILLLTLFLVHSVAGAAAAGSVLGPPAARPPSPLPLGTPPEVWSAARGPHIS